MFYSATTGGFYAPAIHGDAIPSDAVEISADDHAALMAGQSIGKRIIADTEGRPVLADLPTPSASDLATAVRNERDRRLAASDWTMLPDSPLSDSQKSAWMIYRQSLRDITGQTGFPVTIKWPTVPSEGAV